MTVRDKAIRAMQDMPDDASVEDIMVRLLLLANIERGIAQADAGIWISHEEAKDRMAKWLP